jgi:site-specific DNA recombinase
MVEVRAAAVYARISSDPDGTRLGVERQVADCRDLAAAVGGPVAEVYVDNDVSAFSGKTRPGYARLLSDLRAGVVDAVLCYHPDRLTRRPVELESFVETLDAAGVRAVRFVSGGSDLGTGDGLLIGRIMAAVAANESAAKSRRVKRKLDEVAAAGRPHGGYRRPFGYAEDKITIVESEAAVIGELVARYLAGESLRSLCVWLDATGVRTVGGGVWRTPTVRQLISSGRVAGLREHRGDVVGPAVWPAIISPVDRDRVRARMRAQATSGRRSPRRYLLSGLLRCQRCGNRLFSSPRDNSRRYVCSAGPDHGGCGRLTIVAEPVEELLTAAVLHRLDSPELAAALAGRAGGSAEAAELSAGLHDDEAQLEELAGMLGKRELSPREWRAAREPVEQRIRDRQRRLEQATQTDALHGLPGAGAGLRATWATLPLTRQAAVIAAVLDHAVITPAGTRARTVDLDRVHPVWRL